MASMSPASSCRCPPIISQDQLQTSSFSFFLPSSLDCGKYALLASPLRSLFENPYCAQGNPPSGLLFVRDQGQRIELRVLHWGMYLRSGCLSLLLRGRQPPAGAQSGAEGFPGKTILPGQRMKLLQVLCILKSSLYDIVISL